MRQKSERIELVQLLQIISFDDPVILSAQSTEMKMKVRSTDEPQEMWKACAVFVCHWSNEFRLAWICAVFLTQQICDKILS